MTTLEVLSRLKGVRQTGQGKWQALCPAHDDHNASLSVRAGQDGGTRLHCFVGCRTEDVLKSLGLGWKDVLPPRPEPPVGQPRDGGEFPRYGLTLEQYARLKRLPEAFLRAEACLRTEAYVTKKGNSSPCVFIPYFGEDGAAGHVRRRHAAFKPTKGPDWRFTWLRRGDTPLTLYGLWRLPHYSADYVVLVEGESDCHTLWAAGVPALGFPGSATYAPERDDPVLSRFDRIILPVEPDSGGKRLFLAFAGDEARGRPPSVLLPKMRFLRLAGAKDVSALWLAHAPSAESCALGGEEFLAAMPRYRQELDGQLATAKAVAEFRQPDEWADRRAETSAVNGVDGGRPRADWGAAGDAFAHSLRIDGGLAWRWRLEQWYRYDNGHFAQMSDAQAENAVFAWMQANRQALDGWRIPLTPTSAYTLLRYVRATGICGLPDTMPLPGWIDGARPAMGLLPCANGLLDVEAAAQWQAARDEGALFEPEAPFFTPHTPGLLCTYTLPYGYDPDAACPGFDDFIWKVTDGDQSLAELLLMVLGLMLVPDTSYQVFFILYGTGGTGKSTFLDLITELLGEDTVCHLGLLDMCDRFRSWELCERLANVVGDLDVEDQAWRPKTPEGFFKDTVSGARITVERKRKDTVHGQVIARHIFGTNKLPRFFDKSSGIWRRLRLIPFNHVFDGTAEHIRDFGMVLRQELPGILNRALGALGRLRRLPAFPEPDVCRIAKQGYRERCDAELAYLNERVFRLPDDTQFIAASVLYKDFCDWLEEAGMARRSAPSLREAVLRVLGIQETRASETDRTRVYRGITLRPVGADNTGQTTAVVAYPDYCSTPF